MPYPEYICAPMRQELTAVGFEELKSPEAVDQAIPNSQGTTLLVLNSVCGCAAGTARALCHHRQNASATLRFYPGYSKYTPALLI